MPNQSNTKITFKKQFVVFVSGKAEKLDFLKNFVGSPIYRIARFDSESEAIEYIKTNAQEWNDYLIQECVIGITSPEIINNA